MLSTKFIRSCECARLALKLLLKHKSKVERHCSSSTITTRRPSLHSRHIEKSFRSERSLTRRHFAEYTHVEAELDFITFDDLLDHLELVICRVVEITMSDPTIAKYVMELNPEFAMPDGPFKRMKYSEAIKWLAEHGIPNEDGEEHKFGDDIAEAAERRIPTSSIAQYSLATSPGRSRLSTCRRIRTSHWLRRAWTVSCRVLEKLLAVP